MKKILVYGGRDYGVVSVRKPMERPKRMAEKKRLCAALGQLAAEIGAFQLIHGGAPGADALADAWAREQRGFPKPIVFPADWGDMTVLGAVIKKRQSDGKLYNAAAGPMRNQVMADERPDLAIEFPGGSGTADMRKRLDDLETEVREIR